ncbi:MAG: ribonuclease P protein component [Tissierellia bacterium]|nr:ribonuclease P protein component [Tissierellia bacterium]
MKKENRLRSNMEFKRVYSKGKNYWNRNLILYVRKNNTNITRIGFSVSKKIGKSVVRNKVKRRMREICRLRLDQLKEGYDLVFIPKKNVVDLTYKELESAMLHILRLGKLLKDE